MSYTLVLHVSGEESVVAEVDELPAMDATMVMVKNPRRTDGKELHYINEDATWVYWPIDRINFIEVISAEEEEAIIGFVRE